MIPLSNGFIIMCDAVELPSVAECSMRFVLPPVLPPSCNWLMAAMTPTPSFWKGV